jgi:hypothetical protein
VREVDAHDPVVPVLDRPASVARMTNGEMMVTRARFSMDGPDAIWVTIPLARPMVFALLGVLALIVVTGVVALGGVLKQGPMGSFISFAVGDLMLGLHNFLSGLLVVMVVAHLTGVLFESRREGENLALAMINGRKRREPGTVVGDAVAGDWPLHCWGCGHDCRRDTACCAAQTRRAAHHAGPRCQRCRDTKQLPLAIDAFPALDLY